MTDLSPPLSDLAIQACSEEQMTRILDAFAPYVTPARQDRFASALEMRTDRLTVVLEDLYQNHNLSACLRSCESFGLQDVHIIENQHHFEMKNTAARGAAHWLSLHRYDRHPFNTPEALRSLIDSGYRLVAAVPDESATPIERVPIDRPVALVFGTEMSGLTETALEMIPDRMTIPTCGLTASMNVSVAVAICVHHLSWRIRSNTSGWELPNRRRRELLVAWMIASVHRSWPDLASRLMRELGITIN